MLITTTTTRAMRLAEEFHAGLADKAGAPSLFHLFRVADAMETEDETVAALFHDLLEDTAAKPDTLNEFSEAVRSAVALLTRVSDKSYEEYIRALKSNDIARKVKIADILEHLALDRAEFLTPSLEKRYQKALAILLEDNTEDRCSKCRRCQLGEKLRELVCAAHDEAFKNRGAGCVQFESRYIQYPITVTDIQNNSDQHYSLHTCGQPVKVRPCACNEENKTYFGILLGDLPYMATCGFDKETGTLTIRTMDNPAIFVPALKKVVYGCESWWERIDTPEAADKAITDDDIENTWYVKLLQSLTKESELS